MSKHDVKWVNGKPHVLVEAGVREPICWCGDWKHQHEGGTGKCMCSGMNGPAGGCMEFRFAGTEIRAYRPDIDKHLESGGSQCAPQENR